MNNSYQYHSTKQTNWQKMDTLGMNILNQLDDNEKYEYNLCVQKTLRPT